jgi:hypothetical protein
MRDDEAAAVLRESYALLEQADRQDWEARLWQLERAERERLDPRFRLEPAPSPPPPAPGMPADERRRVEAWVQRSIAKDRSMRSATTTRKQVDRRFDAMTGAIGRALGAERQRTRELVREAVEEWITPLERRLVAVEHLLAAREEISKLQTEIDSLKSAVGAVKSAARAGPVLDLVPNPSRGVA